MGRPAFLIDSVFNPRIYPDHTLSASHTLTGTSVNRLSSGRRKRSLGGWASDTANTEAYVQAVFDQARAFDLLWIDRDHNLDDAGTPQIEVHISDDSFTTTTELGPFAIPSAPTPMSHLYDGNIVRTNEGALLLWLDLQVAHDVRVVIPAMGSGLAPHLAGLMLGKLWAPEHAAVKPFDFGRPDHLRTFTRTPLKQSAGSDVGSYRHGQIRLRAASWFEYLTSLYPLEELYVAEGHGAVVVHDDERAELALFATPPEGQQGWEIPQDRYLPEMEFGYAETEPLRR